jgi:hypothetical protein
MPWGRPAKVFPPQAGQLAGGIGDGQIDAAFRTVIYPLIVSARASRLALLLWPALAMAFVFLWMVMDEYVAARRQTLEAMRRFAEHFVREFERPLLQSPDDPRPIRARLRASPERGRMEILLAPAGLHRYPNLTDHKKNVMYDVDRVVRLLNARSFVGAAPFARGTWVVVSFQFRGEPHEDR